MFNTLKADLKRYYKISLRSDNPSSYKVFRLILREPGIQAIIVYRFGKWLNGVMLLKHLLMPLYLFANYLIIKLYGINLSLEADIGRGFYVGHFGGIEISRSVLGSNCSIHQHVIMHHDCDNVTNIGDNVWIGPHCIITPGVNISAGATISAGTLLDSDVNSSSLIMGSPGRVVLKYYDNDELL